MTGSKSRTDPLGRLALFVACLAVAGMLVATTGIFIPSAGTAVQRPMLAPVNMDLNDLGDDVSDEIYLKCLTIYQLCVQECSASDYECRNACSYKVKDCLEICMKDPSNCGPDI